MEELLASLHTHPNLLFTFGLVELQMFVDPHESRQRLVVPRVLAHSTEVVRAVVRVETTGPADVSVDIGEVVRIPRNQGGGGSSRRMSSSTWCRTRRWPRP